VGGHATSHITRIYIRIKFLPSKITDKKFVKNCIAGKLILHITVKNKT
jgi:hypothetical protein